MENDIVERLRQTHRAGCTCFGCEAADEIERLRAERDEARQEICLLRASSTNATEKVSAELEQYAQSRGWTDLFAEDR